MSLNVIISCDIFLLLKISSRLSKLDLLLFNEFNNCNFSSFNSLFNLLIISLVISSCTTTSMDLTYLSYKSLTEEESKVISKL